MKDDIQEVRIEIEVSGRNTLSMQLCRDGTVGRRGNGELPVVPVACLGQSDGAWFRELIQALDERVLPLQGRYDLPDKAGMPVTYTVAFLGGQAGARRGLYGFRFESGTEGRHEDSLLPYFGAFIRKAVGLTEAWYQAELAKQGRG